MHVQRTSQVSLALGWDFGALSFGDLGFTELGVGAEPKFLGDKLWPGQSLHVNEALKSRNGRVKVILQTDGNCVLYGDGNPLWWTGVRPGVNIATMQSDGNFVLYKPDEGKVWASDTQGHPGGYLFLQDDANLVLYWRVGGSALWSSQTNGFRYYGGPGKAISIDDVLEVAGDVLEVAQVVISFVPGIGAGVNAAIAAGEALAKGENITDAVASAAKNALPGGPVAAKAFDVAVAAGKAIARGDSIGDVGLAATRAALPSEEAKRAFDVGLAVIHGQNVQQAIASGAAGLITSQAGGAIASLSSSALPPALTDIAKSLPPETTRVATALFNRPELRALAASEIAKILQSDAATVTAATQAVSKAVVPPMTPQQAATKLFAALMIWGKNPSDVGSQQLLIGSAWQWGAANKNSMNADDTALANAINAWSKAPNDTALKKSLTSTAQRWAIAKGVVPKPPLHVVHETAPAKKPVVVTAPPPRAAPRPTVTARAGVYPPYPKMGGRAVV
jgi:hypothetical protein